MAVKQSFNKPAKAKIVTTLPALAHAENGELYYDSANGKIALKTTEGWKQFTQD